MAKKSYLVGVKEGKNGKTIMVGKPLGQYRAAEFAVHALPQLAVKRHRVASDLGIFCDGELVS